MFYEGVVPYNVHLLGGAVFLELCSDQVRKTNFVRVHYQNTQLGFV